MGCDNKNLPLSEDEGASEDIVVMAATSKGMWPFIPASMLMTAMCLLLAKVEFIHLGSLFRQSVGWFGTVFFGYALVVVTKRTLGFGLPVIYLTPQGFLATQVLKNPVAWEDVIAVSKWSFSGSDVLVVKVTDEAMRAAGLTLVARVSLFPNRLLNIDGLAIALSGMPTTASQFVRKIKSYRWKIIQANKKRAKIEAQKKR